MTTFYLILFTMQVSKYVNHIISKKQSKLSYGRDHRHIFSEECPVANVKAPDLWRSQNSDCLRKHQFNCCMKIPTEFIYILFFTVTPEVSWQGTCFLIKYSM